MKFGTSHLTEKAQRLPQYAAGLLARLARCAGWRSTLRAGFDTSLHRPSKNVGFLMAAFIACLSGDEGGHQRAGIKKKMTRRGYHTPNVTTSILRRGNRLFSISSS